MLLVIVAFLATRDHQRDDSPTLDEPYHVFAAAEVVEDGTFWINLEHPPLAKLLAGLSLRSVAPLSPQRGRLFVTTPHNEFLRFTYQNRVSADRMVAAARRPFPWLLVLLVVVVFAAGRFFAGPLPALLAAGLVALDPNFVAHAALVHTDVPAALTMTATVVLAIAAATRRHLGWWLAAGVALGVALATKFTAILLVPFALALPLLAFLLVTPRPRLLTSLGGALVALGAALLVLSGIYSVAMRRMSPERAEDAVRTYLGVLRNAPAEVIERHVALSRFSPSLGHYAAGLEGVALYSTRGRGWNYFHGRAYEGPNAAYFPALFLLKSTPAFLLFVLAFLALSGKRLVSFLPVALLLPAALVLATSLRSSFNIGHRHLLPMYPLLALAGALLLAARLPARAFRLAAAALLVSSAVSLAASHPNELSYFNLLAGGPEGGKRWATDSNVDWGQDMKRLARWLTAHGAEETTTVVTYSGLATNYYSPKVKLLDEKAPIAPGRYAVGATMEALGVHTVALVESKEEAARVGELVDALRSRGRRVDQVGGSLTIYELP